MNCALSVAVKDCLGITCCKFCEPHELGVELPAGIQPIDYCVTAKLWDKLFHIAFQSTD